MTLSVSDKETLGIVGTDGYVFLRFLRVLVKVTAFAGIWGLFGTFVNLTSYFRIYLFLRLSNIA